MSSVSPADEDACDCEHFVPLPNRPHRCFECGGTQPEEVQPTNSPPARATVMKKARSKLRDECIRQQRAERDQAYHDRNARLGALSWERVPVFAKDHDVDCTCLDCVMKRMEK